ncbi:hypothetical protein KC726_03100 [Candidatus Woesebacteria bacterium]|nr:hypothetical protein [Candidatus Woesebacteria bacterium]
MERAKGEITTLLAVGALVVVGIASFITSTLNTRPIKTQTQAAQAIWTCPQDGSQADAEAIDTFTRVWGGEQNGAMRWRYERALFLTDCQNPNICEGGSAQNSFAGSGSVPVWLNCTNPPPAGGGGGSQPPPGGGGTGTGTGGTGGTYSGQGFICYNNKESNGSFTETNQATRQSFISVWGGKCAEPERAGASRWRYQRSLYLDPGSDGSTCEQDQNNRDHKYWDGCPTPSPIAAPTPVGAGGGGSGSGSGLGGTGGTGTPTGVLSGTPSVSPISGTVTPTPTPIITPTQTEYTYKATVTIKVQYADECSKYGLVSLHINNIYIRGDNTGSLWFQENTPLSFNIDLNSATHETITDYTFSASYAETMTIYYDTIYFQTTINRPYYFSNRSSGNLTPVWNGSMYEVSDEYVIDCRDITTIITSGLPTNTPKSTNTLSPTSYNLWLLYCFRIRCVWILFFNKNSTPNQCMQTCMALAK